MPLESLEKYKKDIYLCTRCGYCRDMVRARDNSDLICPLRESTGGFDFHTARGRNWIARQLLEGRINVRNFSERSIDYLYSDLLCGNCTGHCLVIEPKTWDKFPNNLFEDHMINIDGITRALRSLVVEEGIPPLEIRKVLRNFYQYSNPFGRSRKERDAFTRELDFDIKNAAEERCGILFYVGSIASYDERSQRTARAVARILKTANVDFGILGTQEEDSGGDIRELGDEGLFEEMAKRNLELFREHEITMIVCLSPHDYSVFLNDYPESLKEDWSRLGITIQHYTKFIAALIHDGKLGVRVNFDKKVTYHDPCKLGRRNNIYDAPRKLIQATGANLIEMKLSRSNSYCCGGGGGRLWYEPLDKSRVENQRAKQALDTGADILAVACPTCARMLEDGMKDIVGEMKVMDVAEILEESITSK